MSACAGLHGARPSSTAKSKIQQIDALRRVSKARVEATSFPGTFTHATEYSVSDYMHWSDLAARFDYTLEELQKTGALFWAWLATGRPPLPT